MQLDVENLKTNVSKYCYIKIPWIITIFNHHDIYMVIATFLLTNIFKQTIDIYESLQFSHFVLIILPNVQRFSREKQFYSFGI